MTTDLKAMYKKVHKDAFPETMTILLGDEKLVYHKRVWTLAASPAAACAGVVPVRASCRP